MLNKSIKKVTTLSLIVLLITLSFAQLLTTQPKVKASSDLAVVHDQLQVSPGVNYRDERLSINARVQATRVMEIDLNDSYTKVGVGIPDPFPSLLTTTTQARRASKENHHVVGSINASFFHFDNRLPAYLLAENNHIFNLGAISANSSGYMRVPAAFGIDKNGKSLIDRYELQTTVTAGSTSVSVVAFNRARGSGEVVIYTPAHRFETTRENEFGVEIVVSSPETRIDHDLKFGEELVGTVEKIRRYGETPSSTIPSDGLVISGQSSSLSQIIQGLEIGDEIKVKIEVEDQWKDADFMLASGPLLVQKGKVDMTIDPTSPRATERHPRTAVAVNKERDRVFFVTVDGRQPGYSTGMTLNELAEYLVSVGAYQAINLDGGGSTTMATRFYGQQYPIVANQPSDGFQRSVSTVLHAISTAPYGEATYMKLNRSADEKTVIGTSMEIKPDYVIDQYFNPLPINMDEFSITVEGEIGRVEGNRFFAEKIGTGKLHVQYKSVEATVNVTVENIEKLELQPGKVVIGPNATQEMAVIAYSKNQKVDIDDSVVQWSVEGDVGTLEDAVFTAGSGVGKGSITAAVSDTKATVAVEVREKPLLLSTFDDVTNWRADMIRAYASLSGNFENEPVREGSGSAKLFYDMSVGEAGTAAAYVIANQPLTIQGYPDHLGIWVYGNASRNWLRGNVVDGTGQRHTIDFTSDGGLDWSGWKYVTADIPKNLPTPLAFERIYVVETVQSRQGSGILYFDQLQVGYSASYQETYFTIDSEDETVSVDKKWRITFNSEVDEATVNHTNIYVIDQFGNKQPINLEIGEEESVISVYAPEGGYQLNEHYQLVITSGVKSTNGVPLVNSVTKTFKVQ